MIVLSILKQNLSSVPIGFITKSLISCSQSPEFNPGHGKRSLVSVKCVLVTPSFEQVKRAT